MSGEGAWLRNSERKKFRMLHAEGWHINHKRVERIWAARGAEGTDEAAEAGQNTAQRRVVHPVSGRAGGTMSGPMISFRRGASGGRWYGVEKGQPPIDVVVHMTEAAAQPNRGERLPLLLIQRDLRGDARLAIPPRHAGLPNCTGSRQRPNPRARGIA